MIADHCFQLNAWVSTTPTIEMFEERLIRSRPVMEYIAQNDEASGIELLDQSGKPLKVVGTLPAGYRQALSAEERALAEMRIGN